MRGLLLSLTVCIAATTAFAQPVVNNGGVLNAASYALSDLPGGAIARGSMFLVFGQRMGPATLAQVDAFPLSTSLGGTSIKVTVGGATVDAYMVYTSAGQVAAIMPSNTNEGNGTLTLSFGGQASAAVPVRVVRSSFGAFAINQAGTGPAVSQNVVSEANRPVNALNAPAKPGQTMILWGTGLGPSNQDANAPTVGNIDGSVELFVGGKPVPLAYKGRSGCCSGIDQIVFNVPQGVEGCHVPVAVKTGDIISNFTTLAVSNTNTCSDPNGLSAQQIEQAQSSGNFSTGFIALSRSNSKFDIPGQGSFDMKSDNGSGAFFRYSLDKLLRSDGFNPNGYNAVSVGSCVLMTYKGDTISNVDPVLPTALDAGSISVTGPRGTKQLTKAGTGYYAAKLGGGGFAFPGAPPGEPDFLEPGSYTVTGSGGADVGAFSANLTIPQLLNWDNIASISNVTRAQGVEVTWSGGDPAGYVDIFGASSTATTTAAFYCQERASARRFNIPSYVLLSLPPTVGESFGFLSVSGTSAPASFTATGLNSGSIISSSGNQKTVSYR